MKTLSANEVVIAYAWASHRAVIMVLREITNAVPVVPMSARRVPQSSAAWQTHVFYDEALSRSGGRQHAERGSVRINGRSYWKTNVFRYGNFDVARVRAMKRNP